MHNVRWFMKNGDDMTICTLHSEPFSSIGYHSMNTTLKAYNLLLCSQDCTFKKGHSFKISPNRDKSCWPPILVRSYLSSVFFPFCPPPSWESTSKKKRTPDFEAFQELQLELPRMPRCSRFLVFATGHRPLCKSSLLSFP